MSCYYIRNGQKYSSERDMIMDFLRENKQLKEGSIYSSEDVQQSTLNAIKKIKDYALYNDADTDPKTGEVTNRYLDLKVLVETEHFADIFKTVPEIKNQTRLAPEYVVENRILHYVLDNIDSTPSDVQVTLPYSEEYLEMLKEDESLRDVDEDKIKYLLSQIEDTIRIENYTKELASFLHRAISNVLNGYKIDKIFNDFFENKENDPIFGDYNKEVWYRKVLQLTNEIKNTIESIGIPIVNLKLVSHAENINVRDILDLVLVDSQGNAHIFEIKTSKHPYEEWDTAKKLSVDWELAFKRQLLGQHVNIDKTLLYVIPITVHSLGNPNQITLGELQERVSARNSGVQQGAKLSVVADKLIPRKIVPKFDERRLDSLKEQLNQLMPNYVIRTEIEDNDIDLIMANAKKRFDREGKWRKYNAYKDIEQLPEGWVEADTEEEFKQKMEIYVAHVKTQENRGISIIRNALDSAIKTNQEFKTSVYRSKSDKIVNHLLQQYLNRDWEVLDAIPEAIPMGIILLKNRKTGFINVFNISVKQFKASSNLYDLSVGQLETMKVMLFLNEFKNELFPNRAYQLGEIITYNPREGSVYYDPSTVVLENFKQLLVKQNMNDILKISDKNIIGIEDLALSNAVSALKNYVGKDQKTVEGITALFEDKHIEDIDREDLIKVRQALLNNFREYAERTTKPDIDFNDPIEVIFALINVAILSKEGVELTGDFRDLTKYSLGFSDFKSLIAALYTKDLERYDKTGKAIQGIVGGLAWTTPEWVQSRDLRRINSMISTGNSAIGERIFKFHEIMHPLTEEYYSHLNFSKAERFLWGETQSRYANLYIQDKETGKVNKEFKTKNPYVVDEENALQDFERKYLQHALLYINAYKYGIPQVEIDVIDPTDLNSVKKNTKLADAIDKGEYFEMPLIRREEMSRYKGIFKGVGDDFKRLGAFKDNINDYIDSRELSEYDITNIEAQRMGFFEMYDVYGKQTKEIKAKMIDEHGVDYYELNLDTIAHRVAFNKIRKQVFDLILPTINSYMWWIKLMGNQQNTDVSKQLEYITNQIKLAVFDEPLIGDEEKTIAKGIAFAKQFSTVAMLAFRPALLVKELTIGTMRNLLAAGTGYYGSDIGEKEITSAYTKLLTMDKQFSMEFNLIQNLNRFYRIANMDIATVPKKLQTDRHGAFRGLGRWMFATSTMGDYYNRMAVMIAKMIKDGSYEAHSMKDGKMVYDVTKDKRFSYYLSQRDKYKDSKGNYIPKKGDVKYNDQRNLYLVTINQLNKERALTNDVQLRESDLIDKAYTQLERDSMKATTDIMYGSYDKDSQSQILNTLAGISFMQFMTYWPSKMRFWFGKPIKAEDSPVGKFVHAYRTDDKGNKKYLYWKTIENPDGTFDREETYEDTGDRIWSWMGEPQEGLFYSINYTVQDILKGNWSELKDNKQRRGRVMFALGDMVIIFIILGILKALYDNYTKENGRDSVPDELVHFMGTVNDKVLNEFNVWNSTLGAVQTTPVFLSWGTRMAANVQDVFEGDKELSKAVGQSIGMFEFLK